MSKEKISRTEYIQRKKVKRRKRITVMVLAYLTAFLVVFFAIFFIVKGIMKLTEKSKSSKEMATEETGETETADIHNNIIIYVDPGHGDDDLGAVHGDIYEKNINLSVSLKIKEILDNSGYETILTRDTDIYVENYDRAYMANDANAAVFVSIHCNSSETEDSMHGIEIYRDTNKPEAQNLGQKIMDALISKTGAYDRGVMTEDLIVTRETIMPSVLVELGFINSAEDRENLISDSYQNLLAEGIAEGIISWLSED